MSTAVAVTATALAVLLFVFLLMPRRQPKGMPPQPAKHTTLEVYVDPHDRIWIQVVTRRKYWSNREIWVELNNSEARELCDKLHLSAYAAQFHLRSGGST